MNRKKWIALPTAALLLFGGIVPVSAADAELQSLQTALLGASELSQTDDVDGNGIVNGFDLCLLRSMQQTTGELTQQHYAATSESVKLTGRTMRSNDTTWLVQSGSAVSFTVTGTSASVTLAGDSSIQNEADYRPRYAVLVDGEIVADEVMSSAEKTMTLFEGEVIRTAKIQIIHLSEAMNGAVGVKDISAVSDRSDAVIPEKEKALSIEFIGDSITCAYGVEGSNSYEPFSGQRPKTS